MKLVLIRHGQTQWNSQNRLHGWLDSPLTEHAKAQLLTLTLPSLNDPIVYTSDLGRALESANIIANRMAADMIIDRRLRERRFGILQGKVINQDKALKKYWQQYHRRYITPLTHIPDIESENMFAKRIHSFLGYLATQAIDRDIIIVSHGEWLRGLHNIIHTLPSWHKGNGIPDNLITVTYQFNLLK